MSIDKQFATDWEKLCQEEQVGGYEAEEEEPDRCEHCGAVLLPDATASNQGESK